MWTQEIFGTSKPVIAMCHIAALPGDPDYDLDKGMDRIVSETREDLMALQDGGVDGVMFSNEFSLPYYTKVRPETSVAMARTIGQLMPDIRVPFGVNVLWDPIASIDLAAATGALFVREIMSGVYASDFGLWNTNSAEAVRHKIRLGRRDLKLLYNIVPEAAKYLADRDLVEVAKTTVFNNKCDALCVSGLTAGAPTNTQLLSKVKQAVPDTVVLCNTGCNKDNICQQLSVADGAVVGTTFKAEGKFENRVEKGRVTEFMSIVKAFREQ